MKPEIQNALDVLANECRSHKKCCFCPMWVDKGDKMDCLPGMAYPHEWEDLMKEAKGESKHG